MVNNWPLRLLNRMRTRIRGALLAIVSVVAMAGLILLPMSTAQAQAPTTPSGYGQNTSTCAIQTIGWVVCPTMRAISMLADYGFAFINQNFLKIESGLTNTKSGSYKAWEVMRTIANALFVLAFMAIVYAQITGRGGGGYNIKRMLPRLIIGAILVNVSFYVCAIGVEISNIIGGSILAIMQGIADNIGSAAMTLSSASNGFEDSRLTDITNAVLQKPGTVWILLAPVGAVTVSIAIICAAGLVLLIMRKVVVAMLVLASPLMFVAYLLPNTEHYFQQWLRLFFQLLLLYPILAFLLGTGQIISATIMNVGGNDSNYRVKDDSYQARNGGSGSATTDLAAAGAAVLPLLGTWFLLKSLSSVITNASSKAATNFARRGKNDEAKIKAQMDNKAKQATAGRAGLPTYNRKPAFSRLRRRGGGMPASASTAGAATRGSGRGIGGGGSSSGNELDQADSEASMFDRMAGNVNGSTTAAVAEAAKQAESKAETTDAAAVSGELVAATKDGDKKKTAKDIFNNLNEGHHMKDGNKGGGGGQAASGAAQATAPTQSGPTVATRQISVPDSAVSTPATPQQIVAVPVQVSASDFINANPASAAPGMAPMSHPPSNEVANKATERANKYLFHAQEDLEQSSDKLDMLQEIRNEQKQVEEKARQHKQDEQNNKG
ncbi:MAG: type IV secretion system protein [Candidatus Saccharimonadales bacterium]